MIQRPDDELDRALEEYGAALESGDPPDEDDFLARHPRIAGRLRGCLRTLRLLERNFDDDRPASGHARPWFAGARLGDFRLQRELARGGMGIVFEAEQVSLGRRVALKVLPVVGSLNPRLIQRFENEARGTAGLHHPHIVPVYAVGHEPGAHYYAMRLVDGSTLGELILALRGEIDWDDRGGFPQLVNQCLDSPDGGAGTARGEGIGGGPDEPLEAAAPSSPSYFRAVARLGEHAAGALEFAHEAGIIHRDMKPNNLLLDRNAHLWVADFGLAHFQGEESLTLPGDVLGTVRYMSPEQALGQTRVLDHRSDIYSLGATLYELLTLTPVFSGEDRTVLVRRITLEEPRRLTRHNPAVPRDLETIVLKALSKEPAGRYASAQEMADDLRAFTEGRPIRARPPGALERAGRWRRRHRHLVTTTAVFLLLTMLGLAAGTALILQKQAETIAGYREAERQRERSERSVARARAVIHRLLSRVASNDLLQIPQTEELRRELYTDALDHYRALLEETGPDLLTRLETAETHHDMGRLLDGLGRFGEAEEAYRESIRLLEDIVAEAPPAGAEEALGRSLTRLGQLLSDLRRPRDAARYLARGIGFLERSLARPTATDGLYMDLDEALHGLALNRMHLEDIEGAVSASERGVAVLETALERSPENARLKRERARSRTLLAHLLARGGEGGRAREELERALGTWDDLPAVEANTIRAREGLAKTLAELGYLALGSGELEAALTYYARAADGMEALSRSFPRVAEYGGQLATCLVNLGTIHARRGDMTEAAAIYRRSLALGLERLDGILPVAEFPLLIGTILQNLVSILETGHAEGERGLRDEVASALERAVVAFGSLEVVETRSTSLLLRSLNRFLRSPAGQQIRPGRDRVSLAIALARMLRRGWRDPDLLRRLADALDLCGRTRDAVRSLERIERLGLATSRIRGRLAELRVRLGSGLATFGTIDAMLSTRTGDGPGGRATLEIGRQQASGDDPAGRAYLEGRLLQQAGRLREAIAAFTRARQGAPGAPEPPARQAECLLARGEAATARRVVWEALSGGVESYRLWVLWLAANPDTTPEVLLETMRRTPDDSLPPARNVSWALERLATERAVRINCGGRRHRSPDGRVWHADRLFRDGHVYLEHEGGREFQGDISGTGDPEVYRSERWFAPGDRAEYRIPLPPGSYRVTLHFAEIAPNSADSRLFDVQLEDRPWLGGYHPAEPGLATARTETTSCRVTDGELVIAFHHQRENPKISAIAVEPAD